MHILCVTPNVSVDRTVQVPGFDAGGVWRAQRVRVSCGGKGINVARAAAALGHDVTCAGLVAGHTGRLAAEQAEFEKLSAAWTWIAGETRTCIIIIGSAGATTVINEPGTPVTPLDWRRFERDVAAAAAQADVVCISGSLPPATPADGLAALVAAARGDGRPVWVDTSMPVLTGAFDAAPVAIKINADEAAVLLGRTLAGTKDLAAAARVIADRCAGPVAITNGADPAVLLVENVLWQAVPPRTDVVSAVGSGDCFLAGLALALAEGAAPGEALRRAVAAGTANALEATAGHIDLSDVARLTAETRVDRFVQ